MSRYELSNRAREDVDEIIEYLSQYSIPAAEEFLEQVDQKGQFLAKHPRVGADRSDIHPGLRVFPLWRRFVAFFTEIKGAVEIVRVLDGSRDLPALFDEMNP